MKIKVLTDILGGMRVFVYAKGGFGEVWVGRVLFSDGDRVFLKWNEPARQAVAVTCGKEYATYGYDFNQQREMTLDESRQAAWALISAEYPERRPDYNPMEWVCWGKPRPGQANQPR